jgi:hypothetical protein
MIMLTEPTLEPMEAVDAIEACTAFRDFSAHNNTEAIKQITRRGALFVGGKHQRAAQLVTARDHLEQQVSVARVIGQISNFIHAE